MSLSLSMSISCLYICCPFIIGSSIDRSKSTSSNSFLIEHFPAFRTGQMGLNPRPTVRITTTPAITLHFYKLFVSVFLISSSSYLSPSFLSHCELANIMMMPFDVRHSFKSTDPIETGEARLGAGCSAGGGVGVVEQP